MAYVGQVEDSEEDVVEEGGCVDDDLLGCEVGRSPGNIIDRGKLPHRRTCFLLAGFFYAISVLMEGIPFKSTLWAVPMNRF